jgi:hypothetical protein
LRSTAIEGPEIETMAGYAVAVSRSGDTIQFAFNTDSSATSGEAMDATGALWRLGTDGLWTVPPITCLTKGRSVEVGTIEAQASASPGLLTKTVVWVTCLTPETTTTAG